MGSLWDAITGKQAQDGAALDARLKRLNDEKLERGDWNREQYDMAETNRLSGVILDPVSEVVTAAKEGAIEGLDVMASGINDTANKVAGAAASFTFKAIPIWVWIGGLAYLAWQLGWGAKLISKLRA